MYKGARCYMYWRRYRVPKFLGRTTGLALRPLYVDRIQIAHRSPLEARGSNGREERSSMVMIPLQELALTYSTLLLLIFPSVSLTLQNTWLDRGRPAYAGVHWGCMNWNIGPFPSVLLFARKICCFFSADRRTWAEADRNLGNLGNKIIDLYVAQITSRRCYATICFQYTPCWQYKTPWILVLCQVPHWLSGKFWIMMKNNRTYMAFAKRNNIEMFPGPPHLVWWGIQSHKHPTFCTLTI